MSQALPQSLEEMEALINRMSPVQRAALAKTVEPMAKKPWLPQPGPQTEAFWSKADETLYGGAAGGGKTDLVCGLALTAHTKSLIFRAQSTDLDGLWDRLSEVAGTLAVQNNRVKKAMKTADGRSIEGGHLDLPGSEKTWQGRPHDLIAFDEAAQLDEMKVEFVTRWLRSVDIKQRKRVVFATNPPIPELKNGVMVDTGVGDWLLRWFAPWIDDTYANPAKDGELRWCFMRAEGDRLVTVWVDGHGYYDPLTAEPQLDATEDDVETGKVAAAKSRTFIRSLLSNNVFLKGTGYAQKLSGTPEPLRSMLLLGDFTIKGEDHPFQIIPTQWVLEAQNRWRERQFEPDLYRLRMRVLAADIAQGGADTTVLAPLFDTDYFGELTTQPGKETPTGREVTALLMTERRDKALIVLDGTGGWAGATQMALQDHHQIEAELCIASAGSTEWTSNLAYKFANIRSEMWWKFREALDPQSPYLIALPPSARLRAQLIAPHWRPQKKEIYVESKDEIRKRIGSSTDEADAVLMAWLYRDLAYITGGIDTREVDIVEKLNGRGDAQHRSQPVEFDDPLKAW